MPTADFWGACGIGVFVFLLLVGFGMNSYLQAKSLVEAKKAGYVLKEDED